MGVFKSSQEVLATADHRDLTLVRRDHHFDEWIRDCAIYLHTILRGQRCQAQSWEYSAAALLVNGEIVVAAHK